MPKIKWKFPCTGYGSPILSSRACRNIRGIIPLTPPPSIHRSRTVAVGGLTWIQVSGVSSPQRKQCGTSKCHISVFFPSSRTQFSHIICPQRRRYWGLPPRHARHVSIEWMVTHSGLNSYSFLWCHIALLSASRANVSTCSTNSASSSFRKPDGRMMCVEPLWARR